MRLGRVRGGTELFAALRARLGRLQGSVGLVAGRALCDLDYVEDSQAEVDVNVVMTGDGGLVEVQATAERTPLPRTSLDELLALAEGGIGRLREVQERVL